MSSDSCPICDAKNLNSNVVVHDPIDEQRQIHGSRFVDNAGDFHLHSIRPTLALCACTRGHMWLTPVVYACWCGWTSEVLS